MAAPAPVIQRDDIGVHLYCEVTDLDEKSLRLNCAGILTVSWNTGKYPLGGQRVKPLLEDCPLSIDTNTFLFVEAIGSAESPMLRESYVTPSNNTATVKANFCVETTGYYDWTRFPLDRQLIVLRLQLRPGNAENDTVKYAKINNIDCKFLFRGVMAEEWELITLKGANTQTFLQPGSYTTKRQYKLVVAIQRKSRSYTTQVFVPVTLLGIVLASTFLTPLDDVTNKLNVIITLLLAAGAYQITVSNYLPVLDYSTDLGWFVLLSFFIYAVAIVLLFILYLRGDFDESMDENDVLNWKSVTQLQWGSFCFLFLIQLSVTMFFIVQPPESWDDVVRRVKNGLTGTGR